MSQLRARIDQLILKATSQEEDWDANIALCDLLASMPDDAAPILIKDLFDRMQQTNGKQQRLCITLLDTLIKNNGQNQYFLRYVTRYLPVLEQIARSGSGNAEMALSALREWAHELGQSVPEFRTSVQRISTGVSNISAPASLIQQQQAASSAAASPAQTSSIRSAQGQSVASKLRQESSVVQKHTSLLQRAVDAAQRPQDLNTDQTLQLIVNCREMQGRLVQLIEVAPEELLADEELLVQLISINDELFEAINAHDTFKRTGQKKSSLAAASASPASATSSTGMSSPYAGYATPSQGSAASSSQVAPAHAQAYPSLDDLLSMPDTQPVVPQVATAAPVPQPSYGTSAPYAMPAGRGYSQPAPYYPQAGAYQQPPPPPAATGAYPVVPQQSYPSAPFLSPRNPYASAAIPAPAQAPAPSQPVPRRTGTGGSIVRPSNSDPFLQQQNLQQVVQQQQQQATKLY